jgi:hypothetical protein
MTGAAKVQAVEAVETLSVTLRRFQEDATAALEELQLQVHRAVEWIEHDLKSYWKQAERRAWQEISEARVQLAQARTTKRMAAFEPACREEKKVLEQAQQRLRVAQEKIEKLRHWSLAVERAVSEFQSGTRPLGFYLEADLPRGLAALRHMTNALEAYLALEAPDVPPPTSFAASTPADRPPAATDAVPATPSQEEATPDAVDEKTSKDEGIRESSIPEPLTPDLQPPAPDPLHKGP